MSYTANARGRVTDPFYQVDGKVKFSLLEDEFRDYIALLNQWYEASTILMIALGFSYRIKLRDTISSLL